MTLISRQLEWDSAHRVMRHESKCSTLHGHPSSLALPSLPFHILYIPSLPPPFKRGFTKPKKFPRVCRFCGSDFMAADVRAGRCEPCKTCSCGTCIKRWDAKVCGGCRASLKTEAQRAQLAVLHEATRRSNPAKRPEVRKKISEAVKANHPSKLYPEKWAALARAMKPSKISKLEAEVGVLLGEGWKPQVKIGFYVCDFVHRETKQVLEVQGCYWHSCQTHFPGSPTTAAQKTNAGNDKRKKTYLENRGWTVAYIWEHDMRTMR